MWPVIPPSPTCNMLSLPGRSSSPLWSWSKLTPWWLFSLIQPQNNRTASQAPSFKERERKQKYKFLSRIQHNNKKKNKQKKNWWLKAMQHHPYTSHSSHQHLQRASVVVTPREAGSGFSLRERRQLEVRKPGARWLKLEWRSRWKTVRLESRRRLKITARIDGGLADGNVYEW